MIDTGDVTMFCHWNKRLVCKKGFTATPANISSPPTIKRTAKPSLCSCGGLRIMTEAEFPNAPPVGICRTVWSGASSAVKDFCPMRSQRSGASRRRKYAWIVPPAAGRIRWSAPEHAATDTFTVDAQPAVVW